jgi:hypothetical protein
LCNAPRLGCLHSTGRLYFLTELQMSGMRKASDLSEVELRKNFAHWRSLLPASASYPPEAGYHGALRQLPTTHTFGSRSGPVEHLDRKILFEDQALLSNAARTRTHPVAKSGTVASMAVRLGLNEFVFTYLGVHDPYYSRTHFPAFGVFAKRDIEVFPSCNATRRDLASPEVITDDDATILLQFLLPVDARELAGTELQTDSRHKGSFHCYWGFPEFWNDHTYAKQNWQWKYEFHFFDSIPTTQFDAVLWPMEMRVNRWTRGRVPAPLTARQAEFAAAHPNCAVIPYEPSTRRPGQAFVSASARVAEYYLRNSHFPALV